MLVFTFDDLHKEIKGAQFRRDSIAITSENISFYSTGVKSAAFCIIDMRIFKFLLMWRGPILPAAYF